MKKLFCMLLALCMMFSCSMVAYAASPAENESGYWGYNGETVELDEFVADHYAIKSFYDGNIVYVITVLENGEIEFAWAPLYGTVKTFTFMANELPSMSNGLSAQEIQTYPAVLLDNPNFMSAVKNYALENESRSTIAPVYATRTNGENIVTKGMIPADRDALLDQMEDIHGQEYTGRNWTGMSSSSEGGLVYNFKEDLFYEITYRNSEAFSAGVSLGSLVAALLAHIPYITVPMTIIAKVLGVVSAADTVINYSGSIASYYGYATYSRYVLVEGGGPYFSATRSIDYDGWIREGYAGSAELVEAGEFYVPNQDLFEDYHLQQERAYESYTFS